ncbi:alpha/beta hydrolase [uncultured Enterococcus sp.]|uniref:alpha/beta hydrolase n=1 Tax=uncultured Enterococcus sp. TaxID=167972 RepID=UPI002AA7B808|nr:alpha/beta hydrolase [uncultured Enterococcus sp.]
MKSTYCVSSDGQTELHLVYWEPKEQPKAVVQLIHGMAEYIERYNEFAEYLTALGYLVVGHDHLGHGKSVNQDLPQHGYFGKGDTAQHVIDDIERVRARTAEDYPEMPYFMLGHSMGSFALRCYLQKYVVPLAGVVLMGSGTGSTVIPTALSITVGLNRLQPKKVNHLLDDLAFGSFSKKFPEPGRFNWLSKNQENVRNYEEDELTGFTFTNNGFHTLFQLIHGANRKGWSDDIPKELPILLISGEKDPVGGYGKGVRKLAKTLDTSGTKDLSMVLFTELRHELLFEVEKQQVFEKIGMWFNKRVS